MFFILDFRYQKVLKALPKVETNAHIVTVWIRVFEIILAFALKTQMGPTL